MRKFLALLIFVCASLAQAQLPTGQIISSQYQYVVQGYAANTYVFSPATCNAAGPQGQLAFYTNAPITIVDGNPALTETVTPSQVVYNGQTCALTLAALNNHQLPWSLKSATGGLQEAINLNQSTPVGNTIILDAAWYQSVGTANAQAVIAAAKGSTRLGLIDVTTTPNSAYQWNGTQYVAVGSSGGGCGGTCLPLTGGTLSGALFGPNINGEIYPAACGGSNVPTWCSGTTADAWIRAACTQLPSTGGTLNLYGLNGTIAASVPCSTPTKQVIIKTDPTSLLTITENDGGVVFPISNNSKVLGPGSGGCSVTSGIQLAASANVSAVFANAQTDGSQEKFDVEGNCFWGSTAGVAGIISEGVVYAKAVFVNTTIEGNYFSVCPASCARIENVGGIINIGNNEFNGTSGIYTFNTSPLIIAATGSVGCSSGQINIWSTNAEHANGGANFPEVNIFGTDAGAENCAVYISGMYTERNSAGTPSTMSIRVRDCWSCSFTNIQGGGGSGGDLVNISQSAPGRVQDVSLRDISNVFGSYTNTINDTTATGSVIPFISSPFVTFYASNPGYIQPPVLPGTIVQSLGADVMAGAGSFTTGSAAFGTNFGSSGCLTSQGVTCVYTRTNSTAPPGSTFSQQIQITANTDPGVGYNGIQYGTPFTYVGGQNYIASFWAKGDGSFTGLPTFLLWNSVTGVVACQNVSSVAMTSTWQLYSLPCTPTSSGTLNLSIAAQTGGAARTGTFNLGAFTFSQVQPLTPGTLVSAINPYGIGAATAQQQQISINGVTCQLQGTCNVGGGITALQQDVVCSGSGAVNCTVVGLNNTLLTSVTGLMYDNAGTFSAAPFVASPAYVTAATFSQSGSFSVACTNTPVFDLSQGNDLSLNIGTGCTAITSSSLINLPTSGMRIVSIQICQDSTGGRPFPNPTWAQGWTPITQTANTSPPNGCTTQLFRATSGGLSADGVNSAFCTVSGASALACGNARQGYGTIPTGTNPTTFVSTTAVGPLPNVHVEFVSGIGASLTPAVTCNATPPTAIWFGSPTANSGFNVYTLGTVSSNPLCFEWFVQNQ